jgi:hypothetical protein
MRFLLRCNFSRHGNGHDPQKEKRVVRGVVLVDARQRRRHHHLPTITRVATTRSLTAYVDDSFAESLLVCALVAIHPALISSPSPVLGFVFVALSSVSPE